MRKEGNDMNDTRWIISDIAKKTGIEAHVLRYWEKELGLDIPRNELGHRYYLDSHISLFLKIHELKEAGYQLKAIKNALDSKPYNKDRNNIIVMPVPTIQAPRIESTTIKQEQDNSYQEQDIHSQFTNTVSKSSISQDKLEQFKNVLSEVMLDTITKRDNQMGDKISERIIKQMDYLMRVQEELEDERFKKLDETIRSYQKERHMIGIASQKGSEKKNNIVKKHLFSRA